MEKIAPAPDGCWLWQGHIDKAGYARLQEGRRGGAVLYAHRFAFEHFTGCAVPAGKHLDHLCRVRRCVNPDHLEPVTPAVNVQRGSSPTVLLHERGACKNGHPATTENVYRRKSTGAIVYCRPCRRARG